MAKKLNVDRGQIWKARWYANLIFWPHSIPSRVQTRGFEYSVIDEHPIGVHVVGDTGREFTVGITRRGNLQGFKLVQEATDA